MESRGGQRRDGEDPPKMVTTRPEMLIGVRRSWKMMVERKMTATSLKIPATELSETCRDERSAGAKDRKEKGCRRRRARSNEQGDDGGSLDEAAREEEERSELDVNEERGRERTYPNSVTFIANAKKPGNKIASMV